MVESNYEYGSGRPDIVIKDSGKRRAVILEVKHADSERDMPAACDEAIRQIEMRHYAAGLKGYRNIVSYGIAFFEKECLVKKV